MSEGERDHLRLRYEASKNPEIWIFTHFYVLVELFARLRVPERLVRSSANAGSAALARVSFTGKANSSALVNHDNHLILNSLSCIGCCRTAQITPFGAQNASILGSGKNKSHTIQINFEICICIFPNLCYGVYIPVMESLSKPEVVCVTGLPARTARPFVPSFSLGQQFPRQANPFIRRHRRSSPEPVSASPTESRTARDRTE